MSSHPSPSCLNPRIGSALLAISSLVLNPTLVACDSTRKRINRCPLRPPPEVDRGPLILGHRGASFHLPEHTLPAYRLAFELGADYVEPDLVPTLDGTLVAVHSVDLNITSNVHTYNDGEFRSKARKSKAHNNKWAYYVHDFTWEEVQKLGVRQRVSKSGTRSDAFDYAFRIPSFAQIVDLLHDWNTRELPLIGRPDGGVGGVPGIYAELKESQFFREDANISIADLFLDELAEHPKASDLLFDRITLCDDLKYDEYRVPPLVVHSFNSDDLEYLRVKFKERWMEFVKEDEILASGVVTNATEENDEINHPWIPPLVWLVHSKQCSTETFWLDVAKLHISGVGVDKKCLLPSSAVIESDNNGAIEHAKREAREWVAEAHSQRKAVYAWTARLEVESQMKKGWNVGGVPAAFSSLKEELKYYFCELKLDGAWTEDIVTALIVSAEGCDGYSSSEEESSQNMGGSEPLCIEKAERNPWFLGLSFLAIGAFAGSVCTYFILATLIKRECRGGASTPMGASNTFLRALQLPQIDTAIDNEKEIEVI